MLNSASSGLLADNLFLGGSVNGALGCTHTVKTWLSLKSLGSSAHGTLSPQVLGVTTAMAFITPLLSDPKTLLTINLS